MKQYPWAVFYARKVWRRRSAAARSRLMTRIELTSRLIRLFTWQVDEEAFEALQECIFSGDSDSCEAVPAGESTGFLINPTGGVAIPMAGPAR